MDPDIEKQSDIILGVINSLYDENTREKALNGMISVLRIINIDLTSTKCDEIARAVILYNSFGVISIIQQEVLSAYKYLNNGKMSNQVDKRLCNVLVIIRSLVVNEEFAFHLMEGSLLYFLYPFIETRNPSFVNARKLSLAVILEASIHNQNTDINVYLIKQGLVNICLQLLSSVELNEKISIMAILFNVLYNIRVLNFFTSTNKRRELLMNSLVICGVESNSPPVDEKKILLSYWNRILDLIYDSGSRQFVTEIREEVRIRVESL